MKRPNRLGPALAWMAAAIACAAVFAAYLDATFVVELGNRLWACF